MRILIHLCGVLTFLILTGCPSIRQENGIDKFFKNKMDLPNLKPQSYYQVRFLLSDIFENSYSNSNMITKSPFNYWNADLSSYFGVERFKKNQLKEISFYLSDDKSKPLEIVQQYNILKRANAITGSTISSIEKISTKQGYKGILQTITEPLSEEGVSATYHVCTFEINEEFYTFSMINNGKIAPYMYDDFLDILKTIEV